MERWLLILLLLSAAEFLLPLAHAQKANCGTQVCNPSQDCLNQKCVPKGSSVCGAAICNPLQQCLNNSCAIRGSTVCGTAICNPAEECLNRRCYPKGTKLCGGVVCTATQECVQDRCLDKGRPKPCDNTGFMLCQPGYECRQINSKPTCAQLPCGSNNVFCGANEQCLNGKCVGKGATLCGQTICSDIQKCVPGNRCILKDHTVCGSSACSPSEICLNEHCYRQGSKQCGGAICSPTQDCLANRCYPQGTKLCGTEVCADTQQCLNNRCVLKGSVACGTAVCGPAQECFTAAPLMTKQCFPKGTSLCWGVVCAAGQKCQDNKCVGTVAADQHPTTHYAQVKCGVDRSTLCDVGYVCLHNSCYPQGSAECGSAVCNPAQACHTLHLSPTSARGPECVTQGWSLCGTKGVCDPLQSCVKEKCFPKGSMECGNAVCGPGQGCIGNTRRPMQCVDEGSTLCGAAAVCNATQVCSGEKCVAAN